jgi:hypothetical protein
MTLAHRLLRTLLCAGACSFAALPAFAEEQTQTRSATPQPSPPAVAPEAGGLTIYIDPQTGTIRPDPAPGTVPLQLTPQERNALSTSHEGLVEVPSPVPGGGFKIDLQGRFQSSLFFTIDANGKVRTHHFGEPPASGDKK